MLLRYQGCNELELKDITLILPMHSYTQSKYHFDDFNSDVNITKDLEATKVLEIYRLIKVLEIYHSNKAMNKSFGYTPFNKSFQKFYTYLTKVAKG